MKTANGEAPHLDKISYKRKDLLAKGISPGLLKGKTFPRVAYGICANPNIQVKEALLERCVQLAPILSAGQFFTRRTAAILHNLPADQPTRPEVGSPHPTQPPRRAQISGHRIKPETVRVQILHGVPVAEPADAWCLLAQVATFEELVACGDALVSGIRPKFGMPRSDPLATVEELKTTIARFSGTRGNANRIAALELLRTGVDSPAETRLRLKIIKAGIVEPLTNCPVQTNRKLLHADLGYPALQIAIEYEGTYHFVGGEEQSKFDVARWEAMTDAGWRVLRATSHDLHNFRQFADRLQRAISEQYKALFLTSA